MGFRVDDALLGRFRSFVEAEGLEYRTDAERAADALADEIAEAGYDGAERALGGLREAVEAEKARDFERHAERLRAHLRQEILSRYVGQRQQTVAALAEDPVAMEARRLVLDPAAYAEVLGR